MVNISYSLEGSNGDIIELDGTDYVLAPEFTGFGIPTPQVRIEGSAGDGGVYRHSKRGVRNVDLSVITLGGDRSVVQSALRRLSRLLQDVKGPTRIVATYSDPTDVDFEPYSLYLEGYYVGGAESQWGSNAGQTWNRWTLSFQCPNPFWRTSDLEQFVIDSGGNTGRGLLPSLTFMRVSSSTTLGVMNWDNQGDVPAYPVWQLTGPLTDVVISDGTQSFGFALIDAGETLVIDTEAGTVKDLVTGENKYFKLASAPKLFSIPAGEGSASVVGYGDSGYEITMSYSPRFEAVH